MSDRIKLGLTRNRLFEFDNCVGFLGDVAEILDVNNCRKALKTLVLKEPLLSCSVELCENGEAYLETERNEPELEVFNGDKEKFLNDIHFYGFDFTEKLFSFVLINEKTLGIFAHTMVADARSLMYLAGEFMHIYKTGIVSVVPSEIKVLSETSQMPSNVFSVVVDRLASDLEVGWQKKTKVFGCEDYKSARKKYLSVKKQSKTISLKLNDDVLKRLRGFAQKQSVDVSSLVAFAFYEALTETLGGKRKYKKLNVQANERVFFSDGVKMQVGAFNGFVAVEKKKNKKLPDTIINNAITFHGEIYKRVTSAFKTFFNEFLFMRLPPSFADSQYMYCVGEFRHKYSKRLACTYGCANEVAGEFCSFNLNQEIWSALKNFNTVVPFEPLKMRSSSMITFVDDGENGCVYFTYRKEKITDITAQKINERVIETLKKIK